jgi:hypothetical protein
MEKESVSGCVIILMKSGLFSNLGWNMLELARGGKLGALTLSDKKILCKSSPSLRCSLRGLF